MTRAEIEALLAEEKRRGVCLDWVERAITSLFDENERLEARIAELERERDEARGECEGLRVFALSDKTDRIRALEAAIQGLVERGDALSATALPTIDEGDAPALATARAHWIAERLSARALGGGR